MVSMRAVVGGGGGAEMTPEEVAAAVATWGCSTVQLCLGTQTPVTPKLVYR